MNKEQIKGRMTEAGGAIKETAGKAVGNKTLEVKGKAQKIAGKVQAGVADLKSDAKKAD